MTDRKFPMYSDDVLRLMDDTRDLVPAAAIAPILKMSESVIVKYAKDGTWNLCRYVVSGNRVKFFRKDFLQKCGFMEPEPEEPTERELMAAILDALRAILEGQKALLEQIDQQNDMIHAMAPGFALRFTEKPAGVAASAD